jgi:hypothetical protein
MISGLRHSFCSFIRTGNPINLEPAKISAAVNHPKGKIMEEEILVPLKHRDQMNMFFIRYLTVLVMLLSISTGHAACRSNPSSLTANQTEIASGYRDQFAQPLSRPFKAVDCFSGRTEFVASVHGKTFLAPCRFITETTRHLREISASEGGNSLSPLFADHAHLAVTSELWGKKYRKLPNDEILPVLLRDPSLVAIYHAACRLPIADRKTAGGAPETKEWNKKRQLLGFYDGQAMENLPSLKRGAGLDQAQHYKSFTWFYISEHAFGELAFSAKGKSMAFNISFDDDVAAGGH